MQQLPEIVDYGKIVALLGAGPAQAQDVRMALDWGGDLVCVDGGANHASDWGLPVARVLGDMDSVDAGVLSAMGIEPEACADQDTTDFEKALIGTKAGVTVGLGFLGGRLDHTLDAMLTLTKWPDRRVILVGEQDICFLVPGALALDLAEGTRFSILPVGEVRMRSAGLRWPLDGLVLSPGGRSGSSNAAVGGPVRLEDVSGSAICVLPKAFFGVVVGRFLSHLEAEQTI